MEMLPSKPWREARPRHPWIYLALLAAFVISAEAVLALAGAAGATTSRPPDPRRPQASGLPAPDAPRALVTVEIMVTGRTGTSVKGLSQRPARLAAGEWADADLTAGMPDTEDFCLPGAQLPATMRRRALWWHVDVGVREIVGNRVAIDIAWTKAVAPGEPVEGDPRSVVLQSGQDHVIDFLSSAPNGAAACANLVVRVRAAPAPPPRSAPWLDYDVWLVEHVAGERIARRHVRLQAQSGEVATYRFAPVGLPKPRPSVPPGGRTPTAAPARLGAVVSPDGVVPESSVFVDAYGSLRSDRQPDGSFALSLEARRDVRTAVGTTGGLGRLAWVADPGETVEVPLPLPRAPVDGGAATAGRVFALLIRVNDSR